MNIHAKKACVDHDWVPSPWEPGMLSCAWPGCRATMEAPASDVDCSTHVVTVVIEDRRAA